MLPTALPLSNRTCKATLGLPQVGIQTIFLTFGLSQHNMSATEISPSPRILVATSPKRGERKKVSWRNLAVGAGMNIFQVTSFGQPMENMKTYVSRP